MQSSDIPAKFGLPFANNAGSSFIRVIPQPSQVGVTPGAASLADGFPPLCFQSVGSGGVPPSGKDFNGLLNQITAWDQWVQAGAPVPYDATFQTAIGGYPKGAVVGSVTTVGVLWRSTTENNVTNPDSAGAGWAMVYSGSVAPTTARSAQGVTITASYNATQTVSFTAPCAGYVVAMGFINISAAAPTAGIATTLKINTTNVSSDNVLGGSVEMGQLAVSAGAVTASITVTTTTDPTCSATYSVTAWFIPHT